MNKRIGIICAMQKEAEGIIASMDNVSVERISGIDFNVGRIGSCDCVVAICGIGKVFASLCAQTMILKYSPSLIIYSGVAGGLSPKLSIGNIAVATSLVQHDMDTSALGDPKGLISGINIIELPCDKSTAELLTGCANEEGIRTVSGVIASGDRFICEDHDKAFIRDTFGAVACEMEGAAVGQVCYVNNIPCCVMRAISDGGDDNAKMDYPTFAKMAAEQAVKVILRFLNNL